MPPDKQFHVYMLASAPNGTLYIGVTSDLVKRVWQHKEKLADGSLKLAVPIDVGVPEITNIKLPFPFVKVPACNVAVNPSTPVEGIDAPEL